MCKFSILIYFLIFFSLEAYAQATSTEWTGKASYYHAKFNGRKTKSGEKFNNEKLTAANNFLPLGTYVKVTNLNNMKSVIVIINDRMNSRNKRLIDLSSRAAKELDFIQQGVCMVHVEIVKNRLRKKRKHLRNK
jgi:rare lipoprotein A